MIEVAEKYDAQEFDKLWSSIKSGGGINPGTLFHFAKEAGWVDLCQAKPALQDERDIRNGKLFAEANRGWLLFIAETGVVLNFTQQGWVHARYGEAEKQAKVIVAGFHEAAAKHFKQAHDSKEGKELQAHARYSSTAQRLQAMIDLAKSEPGMTVSINQFDAYPEYLGVQNGVLHLRKRELLLLTPDLLVSKRANVIFDAEAKCPKWIQFLNDVQPDKSVQRLLQQLVGLFLCGDANLQKLIFLYGQGANGKSTFIELVSWILGDYAKKIPTEMLLHHQRNPQGPSPDIVGLKGRRLVFCNEIEEGRRLAEARVKELTGGDTLSGRIPYAKEEIAFVPTHKLVMIGNHQPEIHDMSHGMWRRMLLVPFDQTIPEGKRDPKLLEKLKAEGAGILNWAIAGYHDHLRHGLRISKIVDGATAAYKDEQDILGEWINEHCVIAASGSIPKGECYNAYASWARSRGQIPLAQGRFTRRLKDRGYPLDAGRRSITGLSLNPAGQFAARSWS